MSTTKSSMSPSVYPRRARANWDLCRSELLAVDGLAGLEQLARAFEVVAAVHRQGACQAVAVEVPDGEPAFVDGAADDLLRPAQRRADVLQPGPVTQVGEEVRDDIMRVGVTEHGTGRGLPLVLGDVPVLDPYPLPVDDGVVL